MPSPHFQASTDFETMSPGTIDNGGTIPGTGGNWTVIYQPGAVVEIIGAGALQGARSFRARYPSGALAQITPNVAPPPAPSPISILQVSATFLLKVPAGRLQMYDNVVFDAATGQIRQGPQVAGSFDPEKAMNVSYAASRMSTPQGDQRSTLLTVSQDGTTIATLTNTGLSETIFLSGQAAGTEAVVDVLQESVLKIG